MEAADLNKAVTALLTATRPSKASIDDALAAQQEIAALAPSVDGPALNLSLSQLSEALAEPDVEHPAVISLACLSLVEQGGNPRIPLDPVLRRVRRALRLSRDFLRLCRRAAHRSEESLGDEEAIEQFGPDLLETHPDESWAWRGLPYLCQCAQALLNQTPQAAPRLKAHPEVITECRHLLDDCSDLLPPPVHELYALLQTLTDAPSAMTALLDPSAPGSLAVAACKCFEFYGPSLANDIREECLQRLAAGLLDPRQLFPALLTRTAEVLVDTGGNAEIVFHPFLVRFSIVLDQAWTFVKLCRQEVGTDEEENEDEQIIAEALPLLRPRHPVEAFAWTGLGSMCQSLLTFVAGVVTARKQARAYPRLLSQLERLDEVREWSELQYVRFLQLTLRTLDDEELIVLHPGQKKGYRVRVGGVMTLGQLNILLAGELIGDPAAGWLEGEPLDSQVVAAARDRVLNSDDKVVCRFDLIAWHGLGAEGTIDLQSLLFNSDSPSEIPLFEGRRVVLLREPWTKQHWNANRVLERMTAWITVEETFNTATCAAWLARLATASKAES